MDIPIDDGSVISLAERALTLLPEDETSLDDMKKKVRREAKKFGWKKCRLNIYWTRMACGVHSKKYRKGCGYFSFPIQPGGAYNHMLIAIACATRMAT